MRTGYLIASPLLGEILCRPDEEVLIDNAMEKCHCRPVG